MPLRNPRTGCCWSHSWCVPSYVEHQAPDLSPLTLLHSYISIHPLRSCGPFQFCVFSVITGYEPGLPRQRERERLESWASYTSRLRPRHTGSGGPRSSGSGSAECALRSDHITRCDFVSLLFTYFLFLMMLSTNFRRRQLSPGDYGRTAYVTYSNTEVQVMYRWSFYWLNLSINLTQPEQYQTQFVSYINVRVYIGVLKKISPAKYSKWILELLH